MKNFLLFSLLLGCFLTNCAATKSDKTLNISKEVNSQTTTTGEYRLVVEGFDWGAAVSKVILTIDDSLSVVNGKDFEVTVNRATDCEELKPADATGKLKVLYAYISDAKANKIAKGIHVTLVLYTAPFETLNAPVKYFSQNPKCPGNQWIDFQLTIINPITQQIWDKETDRIIPLIDEFDLSGQFSQKDISLTYASFTPKLTTNKRPLIIWLHGGGEGGTDPSIPLIANRAANYAAPEIQAYFEGAYVLVPQSPTFWMDNGKGEYTRGEVDDKYNESLMALIEDYVNQHPNIDKNRIYLGGCSNGGYMTLKLLMLRPDYFAAAFPSALAYHGKNLTVSDAQKIKNVPMWFIHSKDDPVTRANETVMPTYNKLLAAGAKNVHLSLYDHVVDITNQFGGDNYYYLGHFSWIYSHANKCQLDYDGTPVKVNGQPTTLMGWLASHSKTSK
ncbi:MAG: prolyl oligopeptidase family serine peptidase [Saprospiraceae bacterium]